MAKEAKNIITTICDEQCNLSDKVSVRSKNIDMQFYDRRLVWSAPLVTAQAQRPAYRSSRQQEEARQEQEKPTGCRQTWHRELPQNTRRSHNVRIFLEDLQIAVFDKAI